ncbi:hypothetical protein Hanom_Chr09g00820201 [Helianthus anomalus]
MVGHGLRACRLGCRGLPFGQWVPRTEYPAFLMLDVQKKKTELYIFKGYEFHKNNAGKTRGHAMPVNNR